MNMKVKFNLNNGFKLIPEGERTLTITKAECTPSGKPNKLRLNIMDSEGGTMQTTYNFDNDKSLYAMGMMCKTLLDLKDGEEFDTDVDTARLVNITFLGNIVHTTSTATDDNGNPLVFANLRKVIERRFPDVQEDTPRNQVANNKYDLD